VSGIVQLSRIVVLSVGSVHSLIYTLNVTNDSNPSKTFFVSSCYLRQRRKYMFLPVFVCLSVC